MCEQFDKDGVVCPLLLRHNVFTTYVVDNIDHNPSSRTAVDSWHGTAISAHNIQRVQLMDWRGRATRVRFKHTKAIMQTASKLYECQALYTESERSVKIWNDWERCWVKISSYIIFVIHEIILTVFSKLIPNILLKCSLKIKTIAWT